MSCQIELSITKQCVTSVSFARNVSDGWGEKEPHSTSKAQHRSRMWLKRLSQHLLSDIRLRPGFPFFQLHQRVFAWIYAADDWELCNLKKGRRGHFIINYFSSDGSQASFRMRNASPRQRDVEALFPEESCLDNLNLSTNVTVMAPMALRMMSAYHR